LSSEGVSVEMYGRSGELLKGGAQTSSNLPAYKSRHAAQSELEASDSSLSSIRLGDILEVYEEIANLSGLFFLCRSDDHKKLAKAIDHLPLTLREKYTFVLSPINAEDGLLVRYLTKFATEFARGYDVSCPTLESMEKEASRMEKIGGGMGLHGAGKGEEEEAIRLFKIGSSRSSKSRSLQLSS